MQALKAGALYLGLVLGTGFVLGIVRFLWIVPHVGTRTAELLETHFMLLVIIAAAWWVVHHFSLPATPMVRLSAGGWRGREADTANTCGVCVATCVAVPP